MVKMKYKTSDVDNITSHDTYNKGLLIKLLK